LDLSSGNLGRIVRGGAGTLRMMAEAREILREELVAAAHD